MHNFSSSKLKLKFQEWDHVPLVGEGLELYRLCKYHVKFFSTIDLHQLQREDVAKLTAITLLILTPLLLFKKNGTFSI